MLYTFIGVDIADTESSKRRVVMRSGLVLLDGKRCEQSLSYTYIIEENDKTSKRCIDLSQDHLL